MRQAWRTRSAAFVISVIALVLGVVSPVFAQSNYRLVELAPLTPVYDINDKGVAVGFYVFGDGNGNRGFKWYASGTETVGLISDPADFNKFPYFDSGKVLGLNNSNTVVGQGSAVAGTVPFVPTVATVVNCIIWPNCPSGPLTFLPPSETPSAVATARAINNGGAVVGKWRGNDQAAFYWTESTGIEAISPSPSDAFFARDAYDVNDAGVVVGWCTGTECSTDGGYVWSRTGGHLALPKVPAFPSAFHEALAINERNQVVGRYTGSVGTAGLFFWSPTTGTINLNAPAGSPLYVDINDRGHIVATIVPFEGGGSVAYLYRSGTWTDLNDLRQPGETFEIDTVRAINNHGWIAGSGNGALLAGFILVPPTIDVTVNGSDGPLTIGPGDSVRVDWKFDAGNAPLYPAEIYFGAVGPFGVSWMTGYQRFGSTPTPLTAGTFPNFGPSRLLGLGEGYLPPGTYSWVAIVDNDMNGVPDAHYYDYVVTTVIP